MYYINKNTWKWPWNLSTVFHSYRYQIGIVLWLYSISKDVCEPASIAECGIMVLFCMWIFCKFLVCRSWLLVLYEIRYPYIKTFFYLYMKTMSWKSLVKLRLGITRRDHYCGVCSSEASKKLQSRWKFLLHICNGCQLIISARSMLAEASAPCPNRVWVVTVQYYWMYENCQKSGETMCFGEKYCFGKECNFSFSCAGVCPSWC